MVGSGPLETCWSLARRQLRTAQSPGLGRARGRAGGTNVSVARHLALSAQRPLVGPVPVGSRSAGRQRIRASARHGLDAAATAAERPSESIRPADAARSCREVHNPVIVARVVEYRRQATGKARRRSVSAGSACGFDPSSGSARGGVGRGRACARRSRTCPPRCRTRPRAPPRGSRAHAHRPHNRPWPRRRGARRPARCVRRAATGGTDGNRGPALCRARPAERGARGRAGADGKFARSAGAGQELPGRRTAHALRVARRARSPASGAGHGPGEACRIRRRDPPTRRRAGAAAITAGRGAATRRGKCAVVCPSRRRSTGVRGGGSDAEDPAGGRIAPGRAAQKRSSRADGGTVAGRAN